MKLISLGVEILQFSRKVISSLNTPRAPHLNSWNLSNWKLWKHFARVDKTSGFPLKNLANSSVEHLHPWQFHDWTPTFIFFLLVLVFVMIIPSWSKTVLSDQMLNVKDSWSYKISRESLISQRCLELRLWLTPNSIHYRREKKNNKVWPNQKENEQRWPLEVLRFTIDKIKIKPAGFMWLNVLLLLLLCLKLTWEAVFWHVWCSTLSINYSCSTLRHPLKNLFLQVKEKMEWWSHCLHFSWQLEPQKCSTFGLCRHCACFCEVFLFGWWFCLFGFFAGERGAGIFLVCFCFGFFLNVNSPVLAPFFFFLLAILEIKIPINLPGEVLN